MSSNETIFLLTLLPMFGGFAYALFKMLDSKQDKLDTDTASAYKHLRENTLDPILGEILGGKRGKYKPQEFLNTPEVIKKLSEYKKELFKFNKISEKKGSIMLLLKLSLKTTVGISLVIVIFITINELFVNSTYNTFGISMQYATTLHIIILSILIIFLGAFVAKFMSINASFKEQITELKGGLP